MSTYLEPIEFARKLRREQTDAEALFWQEVRARRFLRLKFRRQVPLGKYTVDFMCLSEKLVVEIDDSRHEDNRAYDNTRSRFLEREGFRVIRFTNRDIYTDMNGVLDELSRYVGMS